MSSKIFENMYKDFVLKVVEVATITNIYSWGKYSYLTSRHGTNNTDLLYLKVVGLFYVLKLFELTSSNTHIALAP